MASRKLIADGAAPIRRLILSRIAKQPQANGQDRILPVFFNLNGEDRLLRPIRELNQGSNTDVGPVVQDRFGLWFAPPVFEEQTRMSARGRQTQKEESDEDKDEYDGEINDFSDDDNDDCTDEDDDDSDWADECDEK